MFTAPSLSFSANLPEKARTEEGRSTVANQPNKRVVRRRWRLLAVSILAMGLLVGTGIFVVKPWGTGVGVSDQAVAAASSWPSVRPTSSEANRSFDRGGCPAQTMCDLPDPSASPTPTPKPSLSAKKGTGQGYHSCSQIANSIWHGPCPPAPSKAQVQALEHEVLKARGWDSQFPCLDHIIEKESSWHVYDENGYHAYGLPQALPGDKMRSAGADWGYNPRTQLRWMLGYIKNRYGTPCDAWHFRQTHTDSHGYHWY